MSWRIVVVAHRAKLDYKVGCMEIRTDKITKIHLSEISTLVIESTAVSITTSLISELVKKKIKIIFCDEKRNPLCETQSDYGSHDTSAKVREQVTWNDDVKGHVWTEIITEKIRNQARVLKHFNKPEFMQLEEYINAAGAFDENKIIKAIEAVGPYGNVYIKLAGFIANLANSVDKKKKADKKEEALDCLKDNKLFADIKDIEAKLDDLALFDVLSNHKLEIIKYNNEMYFKTYNES